MSRSTDETSLAETGAGRRTPTSRSGWLAPAAEDADAIPPGTILADRYRVVGLIGRGGMGEVYRADDLRLGQPVALKFLPASVADDPVRLAQFHTEVRIARQVSHRNVCRVYDIGETGGRVFLTMEYVDGEDLASLLKRVGRFPQERGTEIARQICAGLAAAHEQGVLHRDLKPANVMLDADGRVRITDFGLAGLAGDIKDVSSGTPAYMAPEQLAGREVTQRSDIFSLGLLLFEIYTGRRAFEAKTVAELLRMQDEGARLAMTSAVRDIDPAIERAIQRCLEPDPAARPPGAIAVSAALPGGDPLAAALAAGETPSPAMVAAAGRDEAVPLLQGLGLFGLCVGMFVALVAVSAWTSLTAVLPLPLPPAVLEDRARTVLDRLGYRDPPVDTAGSFGVSSDYLAWARRALSGPEQRAQLASGRTPAAVYWYRARPRLLVPFESLPRPTTQDPPLRLSGETLVMLDTGGRLLEFHAMPPQREADPPDPAAPPTPGDWNVVFDLAGWPRERFTPATPQWTPHGLADARAAWTGTLPALGGAPLRLEAASFRGRVIYMQTVGPWSRPSRMEAAPVNRIQRVLGIVTGVVILGLLAATVAIARRNLALGRGDRSGALRVAVVLLATMVGSWIVGAHHVADYTEEQNRFFQTVAEALFPAGIFWVAYLVIEPWVRRHWPRSLISWTRLVGRGPADPLVGRDVLIGVAFGLLTALYAATARQVPPLFGYPDAPPNLYPIHSLTGTAVVAAGILQRVTGAVMNGVLLSLLYIGLRRVFRRTAPAAVGLVGVLMLFIGAEGALGQTFAIDLISVAIFSALMLLPLLRFGLLPFVAATFTLQVLSNVALTPSLSAWYAGPTLLAGAVVLGLTAYAFVQTRAGSPLFGAVLDG